MNTIAKQIIEEIQKARYILIISHFNPDADTICSSLALSNYLRENKIKHKLYNKDKKIAPQSLNFLPLFDKITDQIPPFFDLAIYIDSANEQRTGFDLPNTKTINIDHHQSNSYFADLNYVDEKKASTAEVLYELFEANDITISKNIAQCLYVGIYDDSIGFTTPRVNGRTFQILDKLLQTKIDIGYISDQYKRRDSLAKYRLLPKILNTLTLHLEGSFACIHCENQWLKETGAILNECDDVVDMALNIGIVEVVAYFRLINAKVRVSLRSKGDVDVSLIASKFNGGGHKNAAGLSIEVDSIKNAKDLLLCELKNFVVK